MCAGPADWELQLDAANPNDTYNKAVAFLENCQNADGGSSYVPDQAEGSIHTMTAASVWSYPMCKIPDTDPRVRGGIDWLAADYTLSNPEEVPGWGLRFDYYYKYTLAKALVLNGVTDLGGHDWYAELVQHLAAEQNPADGSWPANPTVEEGGTELSTAWAILAAEVGVLAPGADLQTTFILASHADLHVYDPESRHVGINYATGRLDLDIPGATFQVLNGDQVVNLPQLVAGSYRVELVGTSDGSFELTVHGIQDGQALPSHTWDGDIAVGERLGMDVTVTAMVGPLTLLYEDLVASEPIPTVSEWGLVVMTLLLLTGLKIKFGRRRSAHA